jgi:O-antigen biosynthesis protein
LRHSIKVLDIDLAIPPKPLEDLKGYQRLRVMVRLHGTPLGYVEVPLPEAGLRAEDLRRIALRRLSQQVMRHHLRDLVEAPFPPGGLNIEELPEVPHPAPVPEEALPLITVAVCTRDRTEDLKLCLDALVRLDYPNVDVIVVDNAPSDDATERLVRGSYPQVRYVREPRPGLDWARNRAIVEARGEIIAYTDDDVVVEQGWARALAAAFEDPEVMAVTGLVVPYELETEAQILFERYGGFGRGFERRYWRIDLEGGERPMHYLNAGRYGTGANMAYRRTVFERIGYFDPALGAGTVTKGGEDLDMFFRVLKEGCVLAYEPTAVVRHRHRRDYGQLREQIVNNGIAVSSTLTRTALAHPEVRGDAIKFWLWWLRRGQLRRLLGSFIRPSRFPRELIWAELRGFLVGLGRYPKARHQAAQIAMHARSTCFACVDSDMEAD